jgi:hypothetical protein
MTSFLFDADAGRISVPADLKTAKAQKVECDAGKRKNAGKPERLRFERRRTNGAIDQEDTSQHRQHPNRRWNFDKPVGQLGLHVAFVALREAFVALREGQI